LRMAICYSQIFLRFAISIIREPYAVRRLSENWSSVGTDFRSIFYRLPQIVYANDFNHCISWNKLRNTWNWSWIERVPAWRFGSSFNRLAQISKFRLLWCQVESRYREFDTTARMHLQITSLLKQMYLRLSIHYASSNHFAFKADVFEGINSPRIFNQMNGQISCS
jgi:hypothetical protein